MAWEDVEVPRGAYISWGNNPGQHVTGKVLGYNENGGEDFNDQPCPQVEIELSETAASINKDGGRTDYEPGETVVLNCGQVSLKRAVKRAAPASGNLIKITLGNLAKTSKGTVKEFDIKIDRSYGGDAPAASEPVAASADSDEPPF